MYKKLLGALLLLQVCLAVFAQGLPQDAQYRKGVLPNGMTYYIRHNAKDPKLADFYIAQRVGSILEEPRQRGLAHFLEHMAFNGTQNFPGIGKRLGVVPWCETVGIKFGANLNAYTSIDETVYNIAAAPVKREGVLDSCLLILHDWSHSLLLSDKEIDKERGVIHEEWRTRRSGMAIQRLMEEVMPQVYKGSKYEDCMPIGSMNVVDHFPYKDLRDYYKKWYRPDLQAIIVVGDIDVNKVEQKIKKLFGNIPTPKNAAKRIYYPVNNSDTVIVACAKDKEQPTVNATLYMKRLAATAAEKNTKQYLIDGCKEALVVSMLNGRTQDLSLSPTSSVISCGIRNETFFLSAADDALSINVVTKQEDILGGVKAGLSILEQARQKGFNESEFERAKDDYMKRINRAYSERDKRTNGTFVKTCLVNFLQSEPMLEAQYRYDTMKKVLNDITLDEVNNTAKNIISDQNQVFILYTPDKAKAPAVQEITSLIKNVQSATYEAYVDKVAGKNLIEKLPTAGSIVSEKKWSKHGVTEFLLSNGMKVYVKPTNFSGDNISMNMFSWGGTSLYPDADAPNFSFIKRAIAESGIGEFDAASLRKVLAGKSIRMSPFVNDYTEGINASSTVKDFKTVLELTYLYFTAPRYDKVVFDGMISKMRSFLANRNASPKVTYSDSTNVILYGNKERIQPITVKNIDKVNYDRVMEIYKERFADASDFSVILVGNVNIDSIRPMLCQYLATLPAINRKEMYKDNHTDIRPVNETHIFIRKQETPSTLVGVYYTGKVDYTAENDLALDVLGQALRIDYTEKVREEKGGTYGVSVNGEIDKYPYPEALLQISFRTDPAKYSSLIPIIYERVKFMAEHGPSAESLAKIKKYLLKTYDQNAITNGYWDYVIYNELHNGIDFDTNYKTLVEKLTSQDVKVLAKKIISQKHRIEVTMTSDPIKK